MVSLKIEIVELIGHRTNDIYLTSQIPPMTFVAFEQFFFGVIVAGFTDFSVRIEKVDLADRYLLFHYIDLISYPRFSSANIDI